jgi:hypothetical protein
MLFLTVSVTSLHLQVGHLRRCFVPPSAQGFGHLNVVDAFHHVHRALGTLIMLSMCLDDPGESNSPPLHPTSILHLYSTLLHLLYSILFSQVAGAALDVFSEEPPKFDGHPLIGRPDVIVTPHLGASTTEAQEVSEVGLEQ